MQKVNELKELYRSIRTVLLPTDYRKLRNFIKQDASPRSPEQQTVMVGLAIKTAAIMVAEMNAQRNAVVATLIDVWTGEFTESKTCISIPAATVQLRHEYVGNIFGDKVEMMMMGLQRVKAVHGEYDSVTSADNFRNLLVSLVGNVRVLLILIAKCLCLVRENAKMESGTNIVRTAYADSINAMAAYVYAPLAHKLGLYKVKSEVEDLSLKHRECEAYHHIKLKLNATKSAREAYIARFIAPIEQRLNEAHITYRLKARPKSIHSIWQKMQKQGCPFEGVYDLFAIRIILTAQPKQEKSLCWQTYSIVTDLYRPNPSRLRDWLSVPKSNGYESLHTTVMGQDDQWVEVQIRTERMDDMAEHGLAAHWRYKGVTAAEGDIESWLRKAASESNEGNGAEETAFGEIYVFTPKGDLYKLPAEATVLDLAYAIHSRIGDHCTGAIIGNKQASMRTTLHSGDRVNVLTSAAQTPKLSWLEFATTHRAKARIRQSVREIELKAGEIAREQLERTFRNRKIALTQSLLHQTISKLGYKEIGRFWNDLQEEVISMEQVIETYEACATGPVIPNVEKEERTETLSKVVNRDDDVLVIGQNLNGIDYTMAKCCCPIYGDPVFGFVTREKGIKIHRNDCPNAILLKERFPYRIIPARWDTQGNGQKQAGAVTLRIVGNDNVGIVSSISSVISKEEKINIRTFNIDTHDGLFTGALTLMISDKITLNRIIKKLQGLKGIKSVNR